MCVGGDLMGEDFPCGVCGPPISDVHPAVYCASCELWQHCSCVLISNSDYEELHSECPDSPWHCPACLTNGPSSANSSILNSDSFLLSDYSTSPPSVSKKPNLQKCKNSSADSEFVSLLHHLQKYSAKNG